MKILIFNRIAHLNEKCPQLMYLNTGSVADGAVWTGSRTCSHAGRPASLGMGCESLRPHPASSSLSAPYLWLRIWYLSSLLLLDAMPPTIMDIPSGNTSPNKLFLLVTFCHSNRKVAKTNVNRRKRG